MAGRPSKDDTLIKQNPTLTPHELLLKGLSQAKYEELVEQQEKELLAKPYPEPTFKSEPTPTPQKQVPEVREIQPAQKQVPQVRAIPKVDASAPIFTSSHDMAWLIDKTGKCRPMRLTMIQALRQVKKYPKQFEIKQ